MSRAKTTERGLTGEGPFDRVYHWGNNPKRKHLKGKFCRVLGYGTTMHSALIEFEDGERIITSVRALRRRS